MLSNFLRRHLAVGKVGLLMETESNHYNNNMLTYPKFQSIHHMKAYLELMERQKSLRSLLRSIIPPNYDQGDRSLSEQLFAYSHDLQKKLQDLHGKRERLRILSQAKRRHCQRTSFVGENGEINVPIEGSDAFTAVKLVCNVDSGIQVFVNAIRGQVELSSILQLFSECGVEVESALMSTVNDKVFYTFQCKISDVQPFDCNFIYGRIWRLVKENSSMIMLSTS